MDFAKYRMRGLLTGATAVAFMLAGSPIQAAKPGQWNLQVYCGWYAGGDLQELNDVEGGLQDTLEAQGIEPGYDVAFDVLPRLNRVMT